MNSFHIRLYIPCSSMGIIGMATDFVCRLKSVRWRPTDNRCNSWADNKYLRWLPGKHFKIDSAELSPKRSQVHATYPIPVRHSSSVQVVHVLAQTRHDKLPGECLRKMLPTKSGHETAEGKSLGKLMRIGHKSNCI